ncbi:MAG: PilW family protein [Rhodocyclaceae bacterium]|nr:PilW family protein [Rhodocyclaceae bacterium]
MTKRMSGRAGGFSLIELLVAMTLGLFLMAGIGSVFIATGEANRSNENLSRLQEAARTAFSMMARDIREAGINDCGRIDRVMNVLGAGGGPPPQWATWNNGVAGFDAGVAAPGLTSGAGFGERVATEDALNIMKGASKGVSVVATLSPGGGQPASMQVTDESPFEPGDIAIVCDFTQATIFQITNTNEAGGDERVVHNASGGESPGNCTMGLGWVVPRICSPAGRPYNYGPNSTILKFESMYWYIGNNGRADSGGTSLFRMQLQNTGGVPAMVPQEVMEGVSGLQFQFLVDGAADYVDAAAVADWKQVLAVQIGLIFSGVAQERSAAGASERVQRSYFNVVTLRNRVS